MPSSTVFSKSALSRALEFEIRAENLRVRALEPQGLRFSVTVYCFAFLTQVPAYLS